MKMFVVTGEQGEYSDRSTWVSAIYETEEEAMAAIEKASAQRREWESWHNAYLRELRKYPASGKYGAYSDEQQAQAKSAVSPQPQYERGERFEYEAVEIGVWN